MPVAAAQLEAAVHTCFPSQARASAPAAAGGTAAAGAEAVPCAGLPRQAGKAGGHTRGLLCLLRGIKFCTPKNFAPGTKAPLNSPM